MIVIMSTEELAEKELREVLRAAEKKGNVTKSGIWVMNKLSKLGWLPASYIGDRKTILFHRCGYAGGYQQAKMHKPL